MRLPALRIRPLVCSLMPLPKTSPPTTALPHPCFPCCPQVSLFGIVQLQGRHLPFAFVALDLLMGQNIWPDVLGILMGHV